METPHLGCSPLTGMKFDIGPPADWLNTILVTEREGAVRIITTILARF